MVESQACSETFKDINGFESWWNLGRVLLSIEGGIQVHNLPSALRNIGNTIKYVTEREGSEVESTKEKGL